MAPAGLLVPRGPHRHAPLDAFLLDLPSESNHTHGYGDAQRLGPSAPLGALIALFEAQHQGTGWAPGWGPLTTSFWDEAGALRRVINLHHHLTPALKEFGGHIG